MCFWICTPVSYTWKLLHQLSLLDAGCSNWAVKVFLCPDLVLVNGSGLCLTLLYAQMVLHWIKSPCEFEDVSGFCARGQWSTFVHDCLDTLVTQFKWLKKKFISAHIINICVDTRASTLRHMFKILTMCLTYSVILVIIYNAGESQSGSRLHVGCRGTCLSFL